MKNKLLKPETIFKTSMLLFFLLFLNSSIFAQIDTQSTMENIINISSKTETKNMDVENSTDSIKESTDTVKNSTETAKIIEDIKNEINKKEGID